MKDTKKPVWMLFLAALFVLLMTFAACTGEGNYGDGTADPQGESKISIDRPDLVGKFSAGFARKAAMPDDSVIMSNYGVIRWSTGYYNKINVSCVAITDEAGTTFLMYSLDISGTGNLSIYTRIKNQIKELYGIEAEYIHLPNTHNHAAVALGAEGFDSPANQAYITKLINVSVEVAGLALDDRREATIEVGQSATEYMTYVRSYIADDGTVHGDNYNPNGNTNYIRHSNSDEPDRSIQLIRFNREEAKDILCVSWRAHNHLNAGSTGTVLTGGFPVALVSSLEAQNDDLQVAYYQGDAGRMNPFSNMESEYYEGGRRIIEDQEFGDMLAAYVMKGLEHMEPARTGLIEAYTYDFMADINHDKEELLSYASDIYSQFTARKITSSEGMALCRAANESLGLSYRDGLHSVYHCGSIVSNSGKAKTGNMHLYALAIGPDIGLTYSAYEMFDSNGRFIRENSPFKMTMVICYLDATPGDVVTGGYIPDDQAFDYGCYEADRTQVVRGTAEKLANQYVDMLKELKSRFE